MHRLSNKPLTIMIGLISLLLFLPMIITAQTGGECTTDPATGAVTCPPTSGDGGSSSETTPNRIPGDFDGDGTPDSQDRCVEESGPDWNEGCPVTEEDSTRVDGNDTPSVNPLRPDPAGECTIATTAVARVNVRQAPAFDAPIVGTLSPDMLHNVFGMAFVDGVPWYLVGNGWVSGSVVVMGGDCGGMARVSYLPEFVSIDLSAADEQLAAYCFDILGFEVCFGTGPVVLSDGSLGGSQDPAQTSNGSLGDSEEPTQTVEVKKICRGWKGKVICFIVEEVISAAIDWWFDDDMEPFDPDTLSTVLGVDVNDPEAFKCPASVPKFLCGGMKLMDDWFGGFDSEPIYDPFRPTIFVPSSYPSTGVGNPTTNDGADYPYCDALLNQFIADQVPDDGSSPIRNEIISGYLVVSVELSPDAVLPEPEPCVKLIVLPAERSEMTEENFLPAYLVQYDSWPPNGFPVTTNSTVPIFAMPVDDSDTSTANTPLMIDLLGNSTVDENAILMSLFADMFWSVAVEVLTEDSQPIPASIDVEQKMNNILQIANGATPCHPDATMCPSQ